MHDEKGKETIDGATTPTADADAEKSEETIDGATTPRPWQPAKGC